jgi:glucan phosphoethanolaminetransferase (alkaline phosphatase superfamily)
MQIKQEEMKKFNLRIFMIATVVTILLNFADWAALTAHNTPNSSQILLWLADRFWTILRFPILTFFWKFIYSPFNIILFSIAVFLNCTFYGVIVERIISLFHKKRKSTLVYNK